VPIFLAITLAASALEMTGALGLAERLVSGTMFLLELPPSAAMGIILASIRKDGILLLAEPGVVAGMEGVQLLPAVYLAGVLIPCLVTALAVARERSWRVATRMLLHQSSGTALLFTALLTHGTPLARRILG